MSDQIDYMGVSREEFSRLLHNKMILSMAIRACLKEAEGMDLGSIGECLELEEDGMTVRSLELSDPDRQFEGMLDNVFRLRIPGEKEVLLVFNKG
ncbi:MAG: hypothetical protein IKR86_07130 [Candidatus Methanomethylophilaceae archaeon]|jgi:hypothetical protein|nr:hypothetical protein [Candidatus Methanomethylophilaceae archaeon]